MSTHERQKVCPQVILTGSLSKCSQRRHLSRGFSCLSLSRSLSQSSIPTILKMVFLVTSSILRILRSYVTSKLPLTQPRPQRSLLSCAGSPSLTKRIAASGNEIAADQTVWAGAAGQKNRWLVKKNSTASVWRFFGVKIKCYILHGELK